jgi:hypothetical protein
VPGDVVELRVGDKARAHAALHVLFLARTTRAVRAKSQT